MVFSYTMLYQAWKDTVVQSSEQTNKAKFKYYITPHLMKLLKELETGTFKPRPFRNQHVWIPKERDVQVPAIRDKIVQHAMCDNYLNEALTKPLIKETGACLVGRGTQYSSKILKGQLWNYYKSFGNKFYVLKCDVHSYFASIPHDRLYKVIDRYVEDEQVKDIMKKFIELLPVGLALGLQQSQLLANLFLSGLDHFCKEKLRTKYYGRYMDDFYIISNDRSYLESCWREIEKYLGGIGLSLNPKTCITENKLDFIGFTYSVTNTGEVIQRLCSKKKASKRRHIKKMLRQVSCGELTVESFAEKYNGWRVHALEGDCYKLVSKWDEWVVAEIESLGYHLSFNETRWNLYVKNDT